MQINVVAATGDPHALQPAGLQAAFTTAPGAATAGVFEASQDEIVVGQTAYNTAYGKTFPSTYPWWGLGTRSSDSNLSFETVGGRAA